MARVVDYDPVTRTRTMFYDLGDGQFAVRDEQDVDDILERNKATYATVDERARFGEHMRDQHVAHIPSILVAELIKSGVWNDEKALARWLDDPANSFVRTRPGKLSR